jgi:hypothetical protein
MESWMWPRLFIRNNVNKKEIFYGGVQRRKGLPCQVDCFKYHTLAFDKTLKFFTVAGIGFVNSLFRANKKRILRNLFK